MQSPRPNLGIAPISLKYQVSILGTVSWHRPDELAQHLSGRHPAEVRVFGALPARPRQELHGRPSHILAKLISLRPLLDLFKYWHFWREITRTFANQWKSATLKLITIQQTTRIGAWKMINLTKLKPKRQCLSFKAQTRNLALQFSGKQLFLASLYPGTVAEW